MKGISVKKHIEILLDIDRDRYRKNIAIGKDIDIHIEIDTDI